MEAEWEEGTDCENKPDHVSKSAARETSMEGEKKKGVGGKMLHGERGDRCRRETNAVRSRKRRRQEGRSSAEIQRERMECMYIRGETLYMTARVDD